jgi:SnoaL-like protein
MSIHLPKPIDDYVASGNTDDTEALASCFASDAIVRDEGRTFEGLDAIKLWHAEARKKYQHTVEPLDIAQRDSKTVVTGRVSGNFPSSPVSLEHVFELAGNKIASLEIR